MKKNTKTCNLCSNRDKCIQLCDDIKKIIRNKKNNNDIYSDATFNAFEIDLSNIIYTFGLSKLEDRDSKRIIIALLKKDQREILYLLSKGYTQKQIAEELKMSQSNVSQRLNNIKKELQESMIQIMPYIL
ncbi:ArsR family transcriptional regulator [Brachyspira hyodysenteriae]|uniref:sigma factor-like helix-turn-helix DNA-binding protein n=1 Tax=Brachyspira hyodysenteriae TaxID=159 RepID=UPI002B2599B9|nr:sigma factor-like helix-turn-helix DNA-binding protein [Brachyspira hyodysenteriae]WPC23598.1 ArsR family transcriptional regulator [Brachyspira hyodysenteriae]